MGFFTTITTVSSERLNLLLSLERALCHHFNFIRSAKLHKLDPYQYYLDIMKVIPRFKIAQDYEALLPWKVDLVKVTTKDQ